MEANYCCTATHRATPTTYNGKTDGEHHENQPMEHVPAHSELQQTNPSTSYNAKPSYSVNLHK
jgi:hypothetical protein